MKKFTINKTVEAARIEGIQSVFRGNQGGVEYTILLEGGATEKVNAQWLEQNNAEVTGYLVKTDDGRMVCIPRATFEADFVADDGSQFEAPAEVEQEPVAEVTEQVGTVSNVVTMQRAEDAQPSKA